MLKFVLDFAASEIYAVIDFLQLIVFLPVIDYKFPENVNALLGNIITLTAFEIFATDNWVPALLDVSDDGPALSDKFEENTFETEVFIFNMGSLYWVFLLIILQYLLVFILKGCSCSCVKKLRLKLSKGIFWGSILDLIMQSFITICFAAFITLAGPGLDMSSTGL